MEVGALARVLVAYVEGRDEVRAAVNRAVTALGVGPDALFGTLGRLVARAVEAEVIAARLGDWHRDLTGNLADGDLALADLGRWDPGSWPQEARGWSLGEAPGGALGHWVTIRDRPSRATRSSTPAPGTARRVTGMVAAAPARRPWSGRPSRIPTSPSRSCARSTPSTRARPAPSTRSTPRGRTAPIRVAPGASR